MENENKVGPGQSEVKPEPDTQNTFCDDPTNATISVGDGKSQDILSDSPIYEFEDDLLSEEKGENVTSSTGNLPEKDSVISKRKLLDGSSDNSSKILKLESIADSTQHLDREICEIMSVKRKFDDEQTAGPSTSRVRTPSRTTPRKITKRSNSHTESACLVTLRTPKSRPASADLTKSRKITQKLQTETDFDMKTNTQSIVLSSDSSSSRPSVEFVREIRPTATKCEIIIEESAEMNDSQNLQLVLSPTSDSNGVDDRKEPISISEPTVVKDRKEIIDPGKINQPHSEGYNYSDQSSNLSQSVKTDVKGKTTDQESTDSVCSISLESPDTMPTVTSKLISKLSNGNSSTPTEGASQKHGTITISDDSDSTPDMGKVMIKKGKRLKNDSFRVSNNTTPSTISPLPNGHTFPLSTPQVPVFDVHLCHNEDGEFLSLYIVRTDNDIGMDMCKEYQRFSKRFTSEPYLADISVSTSPSSVTSTGLINLPNRVSFASTTSSTSTATSNRTCDGAFVVPQPPRKSVTNPGLTTVKGHEALMKKLQDIFSHIRDSSMDEGNRSASDEKVSVAVQASPIHSNDTNSISNGNASPEEVGKCDKVTPKSSLKKTRVRGRRPLTGKTKRAILPTQAEEPEYIQGMNSPEIVPMNGDGKGSPMKSPLKEEKPQSIAGTPKSVSKLKQKRSRPTSPRPPTPVEKLPVKSEFPGFAPDTVVLAKWVDKRYYSGRVLEITEPNKYLIRFDDGQTKALLDDFIIFGNTKTLPLQGQSVYAMVDEEQSYEPGLVLGVEENSSGTIIYRCTTDGDTTVCVTASELYLTEDQARSIKETVRPKSPSSAPSTPRRRGLRELDLDNIIQGPRSARCRDKGNSSGRKRVTSPKSPKASTSGLKNKGVGASGGSRKRLASESSEVSESSNSALPVRLEEVAGVEPEVQRTPRKIDGVKAGPLHLKGAAKQTVGKKNSKLAKFENDEDTVSTLGPIPAAGSRLFHGMHFLLTCTERKPKGQQRTKADKQLQAESRHYSSEEDGESSTAAVTDHEDLEFSTTPFNKERLKEQLEAGSGTVYSHFDDVPKNKYSVCKLIAPRPCRTAKYIQCLAADVRAVLHDWVIASCTKGELRDLDSFYLSAGFSFLKERWVPWVPPMGKRDTSFFKDKLILLCGDQDFVKFWERVCTLAGANTRTVNEEELHMTGGLALVTLSDCPHEVQNKANEDNIPLVSTMWVVQCLIEGRCLPPTAHGNFSFMFDPE